MRFSDGSIAAGVTVYARTQSSTLRYQTTTDAAGMYSLQFIPGTYSVGVDFAFHNFSGPEILVPSEPFSTPTTLHLTTHDLQLNGRVVDSSGQPVANVRLWGEAVNGGYDPDRELSALSGADGRFQVRMLPGNYSSMQLEPPTGSPYVLTPLPNRTFSDNTTQDFVLGSVIHLSGQVRFSDGSIAAGATVYARTSSGSATYRAATDAAGMYSLPFIPGTYSVGVEFTSPGFTGTALVLSSRTFSTSSTLDLTTQDIQLNGRVVNSSGQPVANVTLRGGVYRNNGWNGLSAVSGADGRFQVRMIPATYLSMKLEPPTGSPYAVTPLPNQTFSGNTTQDFVLGSVIRLSGQVKFSDGSIAAGVGVYAKDPSSPTATYQATTDADGMYSLPFIPGTYSVGVEFASPSFTGSKTVVSSQPFSTPTTLNLTAQDIQLNGRVVNSSGQPVANVRLRGSMYGSNGWNDLSALSGADGRFQVRMFPGTYSSVQLEPSTPAYLMVPLQIQTFSASLSQEFVIGDTNECMVNNGGCSVNATCTNLPGSRTCACNDGYTGDGISCVELPPGTLTVTAPNGGEQWSTGSVQNITWASSRVNQVNLRYSLDNGATWTLIAANVPASLGTYAWTLPASASSSALVRIADAQNGSLVDTSDAKFTVTSGRVILNEILANEPGSATAGEFIELVNVGSTAMDLSGWVLWDATAVRHTFASGTVLAPGKAVVVFGAASGMPPCSCTSNAVAATTGGLSLGNTSDTVTVKNAAGTVIDTFTYSSALAAADGVSMNRSPDAQPGGSFVLHNAISSLAASAGKRANGSSF
ncbi:carboxypeptidase regulatory-like domain-containing protein [Stigmatella erecta]|uniref:carboxypeptidase regulatory-like domain-containing protein n=1 Tax=Stigmatella erecta TaxID=83460 RepID=UPI001FE74333|nr:carboxypeptidase regulatory-like domain-containing protein [Stigmatella erecta]